MDTENGNNFELEDAVARRLAAFGEREVDVSGIERRLREALEAEVETAVPRPASTPSPGPSRHWLGPMLGIAAMVAIASAVVFAFNFNPPQAAAAVVELSTLHEDILAGRIALQPVADIDEANRWIAEQAQTGPALPEHLAKARVQSCCLTDVQGELVAIAVLDVDGARVTLVVARAPEFGADHGRRIEVNGRAYFGHELNRTKMVMANRGDRWLCVMGGLDYTRLAEIADPTEF